MARSLYKDVLAPIPRTCNYVVFHGKRDFADAIKEIIPDYLEEPHPIAYVLKHWRTFPGCSETDVSMGVGSERSDVCC